MASEKTELATALKKVREELHHAAKDKQAQDKRQQSRQSSSRFFGRQSRQYVSNPAQHGEKSDLDIEMVRWTRAVASYTKWLVIVGAVAAGVAYFTLRAIQGQLTEMQSTGVQTDALIKATKQAADAATQAANSTIALERPTFFIFVKTGNAVPREGPFDSVGTPSLHYTITNLGRTPAILRSAYVRCYLQRDNFPDHLMIDGSQIKMAQSAIAAGSTSPDYPCEFEQPFSKQDWLDIAADKAIPIYSAVFIYEGSLDFTYIDTVSYRVDLFTGLIYPLGDSKLHRRTSIPRPHKQGCSSNNPEYPF